MVSTNVIYFDIAAIVVTSICLISLILRHKTTGPVNRAFLSCILLVLTTSCTAVAGEVCEELAVSLLTNPEPQDISMLAAARDVLKQSYYVMRCMTAPAFLVLITAISDTSHLLNRGTATRLALWVPMIVVVLIVLANPLHHLVFQIEDGMAHRGPLIALIYVESIYYSLIGLVWIFRWRKILDSDTLATLLSLYPIIFSAVFVQFYLPTMRVEMFVTSIVLMLVSAFVLRPELQLDSLVNAASLHAYREMCTRVFATKKNVCLVYLEIVDMERIRELVGKDELQDIVSAVSMNLSRSLEHGDVLYYLRNGLFCISPRNADIAHALDVAQGMHDEGRERGRAMNDGTPRNSISMRTCVMRIPEDVSDIGQLRSFVRRFSHLVPVSCVTTFEALSEKDDFELQMALSDVVERAIRERSFEVYYQPIRCLADGQFHSAEALVRLVDERYGMVSPALFIPEAEQSGAILAIGSILLDKVFAFVGTTDLDQTGLHYVEVNLSVDQCVRPHLAHMLLTLAHEHDVDPARMNFELTESSSAFSRPIIERNVQTLADAGFTFSLDDYGAGYSNVTRALDLPFTLIKFDKSFVDNLADEATHTVLAQSIEMMHAIGKSVLVEGIETEAQAREVQAMGADYIQGFLYARPLPEAEFISFLTEHNR